MFSELIDRYEAGSILLAQSVAPMDDQQLDAKPVAGKWSTRQVVCHIADFEPIYADRMKRVIAEDEPMIMGGDPDVFASKLCYSIRDVENEIRLVQAVRQQMAAILRQVPPEGFERTGVHNHDGVLSLKTLLERITGHIPHHVQKIEEKKRALGL